jgi:Tol biopolymer transport system component
MTLTTRTGMRTNRFSATWRRSAAASLLFAFALMAVACDAATQAASPPTTSATGVADPASDETEQALSIVGVGSGTEKVLTAPLHASGFDVTLDGSEITYTDLDEKGNDQVFVMDVDGSRQRQLTHTALGVTSMGSPPQWSPDGSRIAYWMSLPASGVEIFVVRVSDGESTRVTHEPKDVYEGGWASDRSFVFSISNPHSDYPLLARSIDLGTGGTTTIARDVSTPEVSPDGTQIAFDSYFRPEGEAWLSLMNVDGTGRRKIQRASYSGSFPRWSPDSTKIAYLGSTDEDGSGTYIFDLTSGETRFVTTGTVESWIDDDHVLVS